MNILIVAPFVTFPDEPGANRFVALAKMLSDKHQVTLVTSRFCHILKSQRNKINNLENINVVLLEEYGYQLDKLIYPVDGLLMAISEAMYRARLDQCDKIVKKCLIGTFNLKNEYNML